MSDAQNWQALADAVRGRRKALRLTQQQLATSAQVSDSTIRHVERANHEQRPSTLARLERALGWRMGLIEEVLAGTATKEEITGMTKGGDAFDEGSLRRLGDAIRRRRLALRLPVDLTRAGGPSEYTVYKLESASSTGIAPQTKVRLERALEWPLGLVDRLLADTATEEEVMGEARNEPATLNEWVSERPYRLDPVSADKELRVRLEPETSVRLETFCAHSRRSLTGAVNLLLSEALEHHRRGIGAVASALPLPAAEAPWSEILTELRTIRESVTAKSESLDPAVLAALKAIVL